MYAAGRLVPLALTNGDSIIPTLETWDNERGELCVPTRLEGSLYCLPPELPSAGFLGYVHAGCSPTDERVHDATFAPTSYPDGTSRVVLVNEIPDRHLQRFEPVSEFWWMGEGGLGPCQLAPPGLLVNPHRWHLPDLSAFAALEHVELLPAP